MFADHLYEKLIITLKVGHYKICEIAKSDKHFYIKNSCYSCDFFISNEKKLLTYTI